MAKICAVKKQSFTSTMLAPRGAKAKARIFEIDFMRGFDVTLMILIHGFCTFEIIGKYGVLGIVVPPEGGSTGWVAEMVTFSRNVFYGITQQSGENWFNEVNALGEPIWTHLYSLEVIFAGLFVFLSGISCAFARNNFQRGVQLLGVATAMSIFLYIGDCMFGTGVEIYIGILHAMAIAIILYSCFNHFFPKWWQTYIAALVLTVFMLTAVYFSRGYDPTFSKNPDGPYYYVNHFNIYVSGSLIGGDLRISSAPIQNYFMMFIGMAYGGSDSFSPLMLTAVLFYGAVVGKTIYAKKRSIIKTNFPKGWAKPILFLGRHSLIVYIFHQPFFYVLFAIILLLFGGFRFAI